MSLNGVSITSFLIAVSFAAGLNVYATIATLGLLGRFDLVALPSGLMLMEKNWVIAVALILFAMEFVADKIPVLDVIWSAAHTFIRLPLAALISFHTAQQFSMETRLLITVLGTAVAGIAHGSKTAARTAVTASPEPMSNAALSTAEDLGAVAMTWLATKHPVAAGATAAVAVVACLIAVRYMLRGLHDALSRLQAWFRPALAK